MDIDDALSDLLPGGRTDDLRADLLAAAGEAWRRRKRNTDTGAVVLGALLDPGVGGLTYRELARLTGIPRSTAQRWAVTPGEGDPPVSSDP